MLSPVENGRKHADPRTVAGNIIAEHGAPAFKKLIDMFRANESGTKIGFVFEVSRQRVHQWKLALGSETTTYEVHREVSDLVEPPKQPRASRRTVV